MKRGSEHRSIVPSFARCAAPGARPLSSLYGETNHQPPYLTWMSRSESARAYESICFNSYGCVAVYYGSYKQAWGF